MGGDPRKHRSKKLTCSTCRWFVMKEKSKESENTALIGRCRRYAPTISGSSVVLETDWCGYYKPKENAI